MTLPLILVIDDQYGWDAALRKKLMKKAGLLGGEGVTDENAVAEAIFCPGQTRTATEIKNDYDVIRKAIEGTPGESAKWALVLLDVRFDSGKINHGVPTSLPGDDSFGITVRTRLIAEFPGLPIVMLTSKHESELGGKQYPYLSKTGMTPRIFSQCLIKHAKDRLTLKQQRSLLGLNTGIVANSPLGFKLFHDANSIADDLPVLILGESGSGKEILARYIHDRSDRKDGPFVAVNVAAIPSQLVESELFGHKKGSFTGAVADKSGRFQMANKGTLFLDEIGDMPIEAQVKVLRALQDNEVIPVGGATSISLNIRVISATSRDIGELLAQGKMREDLLRRIDGAHFTVFPLRERPEDIIPLAETFLKGFSSKYKKTGIVLGDEAKAALMRHPFYGNVGELEHIIHHLAGTVGNNRVITGEEMGKALLTSMSEFKRRAEVPEQEPPAVQPPGKAIITKTFQSDVGLDNLPDMFKAVQIPEKKQDLDGILTMLHPEYQNLLVRILKNALEDTRSNKGKMQPTPAIELLLGKMAVAAIEDKKKANLISKGKWKEGDKKSKFNAGDAADIIKRMIKRLDQPLLDLDIQDASVSEAVKWAKNQRKKNNVKNIDKADREPR